MGILFNSTALGIHFCETSLIFNFKTRLGGEICLCDVNMHKGYWCHPLQCFKCFEAHSSSASEGGITNKAYLPHQGEKKEENEEGNGKGQEG